MSYSVKINEPVLTGREITFTAPTAEEAVRMARSWSPMVGFGQVQYPPAYQRDTIPPGQAAPVELYASAQKSQNLT